MKIFPYLVYYLTSLLYNTLLISFYGVLLIQPHDNCMLKNGINLTAQYESLFVAGLTMFIADTVISNLVATYVRFKIELEAREMGQSNQTNLCQLSVFALEQLMGLS